MTPEILSLATQLAGVTPSVLFLLGLLWVTKQWLKDRAEAAVAAEARHKEILELVGEYHEASKATVVTLERLAEKLNDQKP